jgi:hypothetical protein
MDLDSILPNLANACNQETTFSKSNLLDPVHLINFAGENDQEHSSRHIEHQVHVEDQQRVCSRLEQ